MAQSKVRVCKNMLVMIQSQSYRCNLLKLKRFMFIIKKSNLIFLLFHYQKFLLLPIVIELSKPYTVGFTIVKFNVEIKIHGNGIIIIFIGNCVRVNFQVGEKGAY